MVNYQNGKIYKITQEVNILYVGSTCASLTRRKNNHIQKSKLEVERKIYKHILDLGWDKVNFELIEDFHCDSKRELHIRERYWIDELKPLLNSVLPTQTKKEWHKKYDKKRYCDNKESEKIRSKIYKEKTKNIIRCKCGGKYNDGVKFKRERHMKTMKHMNFLKKD